MTEPLTIKEINKLHFEKFGVYPVVSGAEIWGETPIEERIMRAIENGEPYQEEPVEPSVDI